MKHLTEEQRINLNGHLDNTGLPHYNEEDIKTLAQEEITKHFREGGGGSIILDDISNIKSNIGKLYGDEYGRLSNTSIQNVPGTTISIQNQVDKLYNNLFDSEVFLENGDNESILKSIRDEAIRGDAQIRDDYNHLEDSYKMADNDIRGDINVLRDQFEDVIGINGDLDDGTMNLQQLTDRVDAIGMYDDITGELPADNTYLGRFNKTITDRTEELIDAHTSSGHPSYENHHHDMDYIPRPDLLHIPPYHLRNRFNPMIIMVVMMAAVVYLIINVNKYIKNKKPVMII